MRQRNVKNKEEIITSSKYFVNNPGSFNQFKNDVEKEMENLGSVGYN